MKKAIVRKSKKKVVFLKKPKIQFKKIRAKNPRNTA